MHLTRRIKIQLIVFLIVAVVGDGVMALKYMQLPTTFFGVGRYEVTMRLPVTGGLYGTSNVQYRGSEVGKVKRVTVAEHGVEAVLSLSSDVRIPSDLDAQVHSRSAVGEQYVELLPRNSASRPLRNGDVIPADRVSVPADIGTLIETVRASLESIPRQDLQTLLDEGYLAFNGTGPDIGRLIEALSHLSGAARAAAEPTIQLLRDAGPVLDSQAATSDSIAAWSRNLADITRQLDENDAHVRTVLADAPAALDQSRQLLEQLRPTLPMLLANLVSIGKVAITYNASLEQILVLLPQGTAVHAATVVPNLGTGQPGAFLDFDLNLNEPPPCTTGFLPPSDRRSPTAVDYPERPQGSFYCRIPQDAQNTVRGVRNTPCMDNPGKRAPTVEMCDSTEEYVPLNGGGNWLGDPNSTTGQTAPENSGAAAPPGASGARTQPSSLTTSEYDPATGSYLGPDGRAYTQTDLIAHPQKEQTWQTMMTPTGR
ncbi:mammalian cell entry protein [Nocardia nova]|uniref:Mammalian cell entry protein n=1 Tax=Nocardia nova TaxID=37330 RepID=A0A2S6AMX0_9NOCA|nr:MlaD family protein [Nocardia nova]PPJ25802.1 mammalian cell entry protein [Nocardia nova]PPJ36568.1 mammalian cell entry protein [Nocardia nova]